MDPKLAAAVRSLSRRAFLARFAGGLSLQTAALLTLAGAAVLLLRFAGLDRDAAAWAFLACLVAPLGAWILARRRPLSPGAAAAWLDVRTGRSGRVVTAFEAGDGALATFDPPPMPGLRLRPIAARLLPALAFAAATLLVDVARPEPGPATEVYEAPIERLREKLAALEENVELDAQEAEELRLALERIEDEALAGSAEAAFEAMDRLEERLAALAEGVEETVADLREELASGAATSDDDGENADSTALAEQAELLERALAELGELGLAKDLPPELLSKLGGGLELPEGTELDAEKLAELSEALLEALDGKLGELAKAGLLDPKKLKPASELSKLAELTEADLKEGGT